jgi:hypothetical protein
MSPLVTMEAAIEIDSLVSLVLLLPVELRTIGPTTQFGELHNVSDSCRIRKLAATSTLGDMHSHAKDGT